MGALCPRGIASSMTIRVAAPSEVVWDMVTDLDAFPDILDSVKRFERIEDGDGDGRRGGCALVGTKFRETRIFHRKEYTMKRTVTRVTENPQSVSFNSDYFENGEKHSITGLHDLCNTNTWTVLPVDDKSCELVGSFAIESNNSFVRIKFCLIRPCIRYETRKLQVKELENFASAAARRAAMHRNDRGNLVERVIKHASVPS